MQLSVAEDLYSEKEQWKNVESKDEPQNNLTSFEQFSEENKDRELSFQ
jgi:hypothetical protein